MDAGSGQSPAIGGDGVSAYRLGICQVRATYMLRGSTSVVADQSARVGGPPKERTATYPRLPTASEGVASSMRVGARPEAAASRTTRMAIGCAETVIPRVNVQGGSRREAQPPSSGGAAP